MYIIHRDPNYDPVKRREYYLKTRQLKGRKKGINAPVAKARSSFSNQNKTNASYVVKNKDGTTETLTPQMLREQQQQIDASVKAIKKKLVELNALLREKMADARAAEAKAKRGPTAAEKSKAARDARKYRDKHKQSLKNKADTPNKSSDKKADAPDTVESLKKKIGEASNRLSAVIERQKALTSATRVIGSK